MAKTKTFYCVVLDFTDTTVHMAKINTIESKIEERLGMLFDLSNCQWMASEKKIQFKNADTEVISDMDKEWWDEG